MDCSTFSFDLHVLGAPPALILSRDQTLIDIVEFYCFSSRCTQMFSDEFCFTASNQIVNDLRSHPLHIECSEFKQASKLCGFFSPRPFYRGAWEPKISLIATGTSVRRINSSNQIIKPTSFWQVQRQNNR